MWRLMIVHTDIVFNRVKLYILAIYQILAEYWFSCKEWIDLARFTHRFLTKWYTSPLQTDMQLFPIWGFLFAQGFLLFVMV